MREHIISHPITEIELFYQLYQMRVDHQTHVLTHTGTNEIYDELMKCLQEYKNQLNQERSQRSRGNDQVFIINIYIFIEIKTK